MGGLQYPARAPVRILRNCAARNPCKIHTNWSIVSPLASEKINVAPHKKNRAAMRGFWSPQKRLPGQDIRRHKELRRAASARVTLRDARLDLHAAVQHQLPR